MLNVFKYFNNPKELDRSDLIDHMLLDVLAAGELDSSDKARLEPVLHLIKRNPRMAMWYAAEIINQRWPEVEPIILKEPSQAYWYTRHVIKERWPEAEPVIMKDPLYAYKYARWIIRDRWPEAEPYIKQDGEQWARYAEFFNLI